MPTTTRLAPDRTTRYRAWSPPLRLLGIWAHPDDEAYLSAGLMDRTRQAGGEVTVLTVTDGEHGFPDTDDRSLDERRAQRRSELRAALGSIGVDDIRLLGVPDGGVPLAAVRELVEAFRSVIAEVEPDVIVTFGPDGITGHPDHVATSHAATMAWLEHGDGELWYATKTAGWLDEWRWLHDRFGVWMTGEPAPVPDEQIELDVVLGGTALDRKRRVLAGHASQTDPVATAIGEDAYRRWIARETFRRPTPADLAGTDAALLQAVAP